MFKRNLILLFAGLVSAAPAFAAPPTGLNDDDVIIVSYIETSSREWGSVAPEFGPEVCVKFYQDKRSDQGKGMKVGEGVHEIRHNSDSSRVDPATTACGEIPFGDIYESAKIFPASAVVANPFNDDLFSPIQFVFEAKVRGKDVNDAYARALAQCPKGCVEFTMMFARKEAAVEIRFPIPEKFSYGPSPKSMTHGKNGFELTNVYVSVIPRK